MHNQFEVCKIFNDILLLKNPLLFKESDQNLINVGGFKDIKRKLLDWVAVYLAKNLETDIHTFAGIPYNPYEPEPYQRWTLQSTINIEHELKVAEEFRNFIGSGDIYDTLLDYFRVERGELNLEINNRFRSLYLSMV